MSGKNLKKKDKKLTNWNTYFNDYKNNLNITQGNSYLV